MNAKLLTAKTLGLPRYVWVGLLAGGVGVGLYLRLRHTNEPVYDEAGEEEGGLLAPPEQSLEGAESAGLAGAGVLGPPGGSVVPVQTPFLPEGLTDVFASVTELARELGSREPLVVTETNTIIEPGEPITGGGANETAPGTNNRVPKPKCSASDRANISRLTAQINTAQKRISAINQRLAQLNNQQPGKHPAIRTQITKLQNERSQKQQQITAAQAKRAPIQARCKG